MRHSGQSSGEILNSSQARGPLPIGFLDQTGEGVGGKGSLPEAAAIGRRSRSVTASRPRSVAGKNRIHSLTLHIFGARRTIAR